MDPVEQAIRDAHANGVREAQDKGAHELALRLADNQFATAGTLAATLRAVVGSTPAIWVPPTLEAKIADVCTQIAAARATVERELQA